MGVGVQSRINLCVKVAVESQEGKLHSSVNKSVFIYGAEHCCLEFHRADSFFRNSQTLSRWSIVMAQKAISLFKRTHHWLITSAYVFPNIRLSPVNFAPYRSKLSYKPIIFLLAGVPPFVGYLWLLLPRMCGGPYILSQSPVLWPDIS